MWPRENNREHLRLVRQASQLTQDNTKVSQDTTLVKENLTKRLHPLEHYKPSAESEAGFSKSSTR